MNSQDLDRLLSPAVNAVLETMFFSVPLPSEAGDASLELLEARVSFVGEFSGILGVRISRASARSLAASFLGELEESLSESQTAQVVCELTNMLCGWILSNSGTQGCFDLGSPELLSPQIEPPTALPSIEQTFAVDNGTLTLSLYSFSPA